LAEKPERRKSLARLRIRWNHNIKMQNSFEVRNKALLNIKGVPFLDYTSVYWMLKERLCTMESENEGEFYGI
jgi:head-tail adaptor